MNQLLNCMTHLRGTKRDLIYKLIKIQYAIQTTMILDKYHLYWIANPRRSHLQSVSKNAASTCLTKVTLLRSLVLTSIITIPITIIIIIIMLITTNLLFPMILHQSQITSLLSAHSLKSIRSNLKIQGKVLLNQKQMKG